MAPSVVQLTCSDEFFRLGQDAILEEFDLADVPPFHLEEFRGPVEQTELQEPFPRQRRRHTSFRQIERQRLEHHLVDAVLDGDQIVRLRKIQRRFRPRRTGENPSQQR